MEVRIICLYAGGVSVWAKIFHSRITTGLFILAFAIAALRKMRGMSQEQLAEKAEISRSLISAIEAPGVAKSFSLDVFFNLADALDIDPADLIDASVFPDRIMRKQ